MAQISTLPSLASVDVEFSDLTYSVPQGRRGTKKILRGVSGLFRSGELTAILGPSGAGKSTLLNLLAGYRSGDTSGTLLTNGRPRDPRLFRRLSRYIMQDDALQPHLTVQESMMLAADLKLGSECTGRQKSNVVKEVLHLLRLERASDTGVGLLSGGERKRLSIALELLNNPPVLFLDEPTTGLDDQSSSQCINLLKTLAQGGRTIICSIHTPSARLFSLFDHIYVVASGQCVYRGSVPNLVPFMSSVGLPCPHYYNPADFVVEMTCGECDKNIEKMAAAIESSENYRWQPEISSPLPQTDGIRLAPLASFDEDNNIGASCTFEQYLVFKSSNWVQFRTLVHRHLLQTWRNKDYLIMKLCMYLFMSITVGLLFYNFGHDGSKTLFNFGFCFCCTIACQFVPMLPVLLQYPEEIKLLKREYFNRWYSFNAYFLAATVARLPALILFNSLYFIIVYTMTDQPLELNRMAVFLSVCLLIACVAESWGLAVSSYLSLINGMFVGTAASVPFMLLAVQGLGTGMDKLPLFAKIAMRCSYIRYGLEGFTVAIYGLERTKLPCPKTEIFCPYRYPKQIMRETGLDSSNMFVAYSGLVGTYIIFRLASYLLLRWRLSSYRHFPALAYIGRLVKRHFNLTQGR